MKQRAEAATRGPWKYPHRDFPGVVTSRYGCLWVPGSKSRHDGGHINHEPDAAYIASMHPGIGKALGQWLEECADDADRGVTPDPWAAEIAALYLGHAPEEATDV